MINIKKLFANAALTSAAAASTLKPKKGKYTGSYPAPKNYLKKGDKGAEVKKLQKYLNWSYGGQKGFKKLVEDGVYGDSTYKWTCKFQNQTLGKGQGDGKVGQKTIAKMKEYGSYEPKPTPAPTKTYPGKLPTTQLIKTKSEVATDAVKWAKWIARDNSFHYGSGKDSHHNGCYFCGTQPSSKKKSGIKDWEKTYCCNPFVHAAWAHGGCVPKAIQLCSKGSSWDFNKGSGYDASSLFTKLGKPAESKLKAGDVLCNGSHVALYIGNGKIAEASGGDDNKRNSKSWNNSIHITNLYYKNFDRVYRFNSSVNAELTMRHGEVGKRVKLWQDYLNWWSDGAFFKECGGSDGYFGDNTKKWTIKFQEKEIGQGSGDGVIGQKTLNAAKKAKKQTKSSRIPELMDACRAQADWMKNYTYKWENNPTIPKSKKYGTCVTYVACVLQRLGILKSGDYIWIDNNGKVEGANSKVSVTYMKGTLKSNKSKLKKGDIIIGGNGNVHAASGSHIFVLTGKWDANGNPYIFDQASADRVKAGKNPMHTWSGSFPMIALIRLK